MLLGDRAEPVLAIAWAEAGALAGEAASVVEAPSAGEAEPGPYAAVLWSVEGDGPPPEELARVRAFWRTGGA